MKRSSKILRTLMAFLMFVQGVGLVATCAVPCDMNAGDKLRCVVDSIANYEHALAQDRAGAIRSGAMACGHLEIIGQVASVLVGQGAISPSISNFSALVAPTAVGISAVELKLMIFDRAGPRGLGSNQALLAVPPQNAPPVLV